MTNDIIEDLFFGRLYPLEQIRPGGAEYREAERLADEARRALADCLPPDLAERLGALEDLQIRPAALDAYACFRHGFCMGVALMREVEAELARPRAGVPPCGL